MKNNFQCVYVMFRKNGEPFYVGKGRYNRPRDHLYEAGSDYNSHKLNVIRELIHDIGEVPTVIIQDNLTTEEATELERILIAVIGRADLGKGPLTNKTDGGEGCPGYKFTAEQKATVKEAWTRPEVWKKHSDAMKIVWLNHETKLKQLATLKETWSNPEVRERASKAQKDAWNVHGSRDKRVAALKAAFSRPEAKENRSVAQKIAQNDPDVQARRSASLKMTWARKKTLQPTDVLERS